MSKFKRLRDFFKKDYTLLVNDVVDNVYIRNDFINEKNSDYTKYCNKIVNYSQYSFLSILYVGMRYVIHASTLIHVYYKRVLETGTKAIVTCKVFLILRQIRCCWIHNNNYSMQKY